MKELKELSANYATEKTNEMMSQIVAQAFADGYRMGYKDREDEFQVNLCDGKTEFVDLGLPSGTLWSADYVKEGDEYIYYSYKNAVLYDIPTLEQWDELVSSCRWDFVINNAGLLYRVDCAGPNGSIISFNVTGMIVAIQKKNISESFFWVKQEMEGNNRKSVHLDHQKNTTFQGFVYYHDIKVVEDTFSGYKLPIRLVREK